MLHFYWQVIPDFLLNKSCIDYFKRTCLGGCLAIHLKSGNEKNKSKLSCHNVIKLNYRGFISEMSSSLARCDGVCHCSV